MTAGWTPGAYLARRRLAAGLSLDDVAARLHTLPHPLGERERRLWLASIEADVAPIPVEIADFVAIFPFDVHVLHVLVVRQTEPSVGEVRVCRICACSDGDACIVDDVACAWAEEDLCTVCAVPGAAAGIVRPVGAAA